MRFSSRACASLGPRYAGSMDFNETNSSLSRGVKGLRSGHVLCCRMVRPIMMGRDIAAVSMAVSNVAPGNPFALLDPEPVRLSARKWPVFQSTLVGLRELLPAAFPVVVRSAELGRETLGACHRTDTRFMIRLAANLKESEATDVLLHEWAHALAWTHSLDKLVAAAEIDQERFEAESHDAAWGCAFARVWRLFVGTVLPDLKQQTTVRRKA